MTDDNKDPNANVTVAQEPPANTGAVVKTEPTAPVKQDAPVPAKQTMLDTPKEDKPQWSYKESDDDDVNIMSGILTRGNISPTEAAEFFKGALDTLDISKADWPAIEKKLGKEQTQLLRLATSQVYNKTIAVKKAVVSATHEIAGGEDNWNKVRDWARAKRDTDPQFAEQVNQYNKMFDLGATSAKMAAQALIAAYNSDKGNTTLNTTVINGDNTVKPAAENLSRADYVAALQAARAKGDTAEMTRLQSARRAYYAS